MGIVDEDDLCILTRRNPSLYDNFEQRVQYVTKLYKLEFHIVARNEIKSIADLLERMVNFGPKDNDTEDDGSHIQYVGT
jgi:TRAP-type uncharacterized transport system substrate-binding protein